MDERVSRREFLGVVGAAAVGGVAGCTRAPGAADGPPGRIDETHLPPSTVATTQFRGGLARRGVFPDAEIPTDPAVEWTVQEVNVGEHTAAKASPVAAPDGDVVVPGDDGVVRRVSPAGEVRWTAAVDPTTRGIHGTPVVANGAVYVGAYDGALYAFDLDSGGRYWRRKLADAIGSSPAYHDGTVYVAVEYHDPSGAMFGVDAVTGEVTWTDQRPTDHPHSTCAIDREAGRLVVGANDGHLYAWTYPDLSFAWSFETERAIKGPVATADGSAFFGSWDGHVYRVGLVEGREEWAFETDGLVMSGPSVEPSTGTVYIGSHDTNLYALDAATGDEQWSFGTHGALIGCPTVTSDHVLAGSSDDRFYAVEKATGEERWSVGTAGDASSTALVRDGAVYVTDRASGRYLDARYGTDTADGSGTGETTADPAESGALYKVGPAE